MADLKIPNLNMKSDKYIFKKKLGFNRKSKRRLFTESVFLFILSLFLVYINRSHYYRQLHISKMTRISL